MARKRIKKIIEKYIKLLIDKEYRLKRVFLFGSYTGNKNQTMSDIDLAIVLKGKFDDFQEQLNLMRIRRNVDIRIEPHLFTEEDFHCSNPFAREIMEQGEKIY